MGFNPWVGEIPWRKKWQPTPVFLPGKSHGWRSLAGYSPKGHHKSVATESTHTHTTPFFQWVSGSFSKDIARFTEIFTDSASFMCPTSEPSLGKDTSKVWDIPNEPVYETIKLLDTENRPPHVENRLLVSKGEEVGRGMDWELGVGRCKLLDTKWINQVL